MVIRQALPFDFAPRGRRKPARTTLIVAGSVAVHAAVAAYLAMMQFAPPKALPVEEPPLMELEFYTPPKPPPPPKSDSPPKVPQIVPNQVLPTATPPTSVAPLQIDIPDEPVRTVGPLASLTPTPEPTPPRAPDIGNPNWLKRPGPSEFARFYPDRAARMNQEGSATITCAVTASGSLTGCRLVRETPADFGFGSATLKLAQYFRMSPRTVDGQPVEGGQVTIPIRFNLN